MGRVYLAEDPNIGRRLALKILSPERLSEPEKQAELHARFLAEARAAGGLTHPGIVTVYDADSDPLSGDPYLAMELVEGHSLRQILDREAPLSVSRTLDLVSQVARALSFAHHHEVVHRDVKPANLLVRPDGVVKVVDFGIAKLVSPALTQPGKLLGTPFYMAPEQLRSRPLDGRADLFSLGVVLYECLAGYVPFSGDSIAAVQLQILQEDPPRIDSIPDPLRRVIDRALAKEPDERYATGDELADELDAFASELPTQPIPRYRPAAGGPGLRTTELPAPPMTGPELDPSRPTARDENPDASAGSGKTPPPPPPPPPPPTAPSAHPVAPPMGTGYEAGGQTPVPPSPAPSRPTAPAQPKDKSSAPTYAGLVLGLLVLALGGFGLARWLGGGEGPATPEERGRRIAGVMPAYEAPTLPPLDQLVLPVEPPPVAAPPPRRRPPPPSAVPPPPEELVPAEPPDPVEEAEPSSLEVVIVRNRANDPIVTIQVGGEIYFDEQIDTNPFNRRRLELPIFELPSGRQALMVTLINNKGQTVARGEVLLDLEPGGPFRLQFEHPPNSDRLDLSDEVH